jgi:hypothetical protein
MNPIRTMVMDVSPELLAIEKTNELKELTALVSDYHVPLENVHLELGSTREVLCRLAHQLNADVMTMR